jgi:hypothetical protein
MNPARIAGLLLPGLLVLAGCSSSRSVSMNSMQPAEIALPGDVRTILILDRSALRDRTTDIVEGILTGETPDQDRASLQAMVASLRDQLAWSGRFETRVAREVLPGNSISGVLPTPLAWDQVKELLEKYGADALLSVEVFDSDFIVTKGRRLKEEKTESQHGADEAPPQYYAEGVANLTIGLRLYDLRRNDVVDEALFKRNHSWEATGSTIRDALVALIDKAEAASYVSRGVGADYAAKIAPMPIRISRTFYGKSKRVPEMERGGRHADMADWREAARIWESGIAQAPEKEAGQLCFNIAIAHEVLGEWEEARQWARRSYLEFGNDDARDYVSELNQRVRREEVAAQQMQ